MITDNKKSILERVNFFVLFSFDLTLLPKIDPNPFGISPLGIVTISILGLKLSIYHPSMAIWARFLGSLGSSYLNRNAYAHMKNNRMPISSPQAYDCSEISNAFSIFEALQVFCDLSLED